MLNGEFTDDMDDLRGLDLVELQQLKSDVNERINYLTDSLKGEDFPPVVVPDVVSDDDNNE